MTGNYEEKIFLIEVEKIKPNPYQPRHEFNEERLRDLADSIKQYGVLQPLVVTRNEIERADGSIYTEYEIIAGERRWRAAQIAGLPQVPAVIRTGEQSDKEKLELAIIENLQREDLNPVDRAQAFFKLANEFGLSHTEIAKRIGRSREYVSNTIRILNLPQDILDAVVNGQIAEGHTRPLLMLTDRPEEQLTLFKEIIIKRLNVRDTEQIARRVAYDKVRRHSTIVKPEIIEIEEKLTEKYGNRVKVEMKGEDNGRIMIDYTSAEELSRILSMLGQGGVTSPLDSSSDQIDQADNSSLSEDVAVAPVVEEEAINTESEDDDLYFIKNFSI